jgi:hypothetical protein
MTAVGEERVQAERLQLRRWMVERRPAWITGNRRTSRDYERLPVHAEAKIQWAMIDGPPPRSGAWPPSLVAQRRLAPFSTRCQMTIVELREIRRRRRAQGARRY